MRTIAVDLEVYHVLMEMVGRKRVKEPTKAWSINDIMRELLNI